MKNTPRPPWIPGSKLETALSSFSEELREMNWSREGQAAAPHTVLTQRSLSWDPQIDAHLETL